MKILITDTNTFTGDDLAIGKYYYVEPADTGTLQQGRCFHGLLHCYLASGCIAYPVSSYEDLKSIVKKNLGAGYESYVYIEDTGNGLLKGKVKTRDEVPNNLAIDKNGRKMVWGNLKHWADYTKKERAETIDRLIAEMIYAGVNSKKFNEILETMELNSMRKAG